MARRRVWRMAHRGASGCAPEQTRAALLAALRARADWIECDVRLTRDEQPILWHDARVERTSDGAGAVADFTLRQLRVLDCGSWFHARYAGARVLTLTDALRLVQGRARLNIELKTEASETLPHLVARVLRCVRGAGAVGHVLLSSFDAAALEEARRHAPRLPRALITARHLRASLRLAVGLGAVAIHPHVDLATAACIERAHAAGLAVHAWTVDRPRDIRRLLARGVDGVFSNCPERVPRWWPA